MLQSNRSAVAAAFLAWLTALALICAQDAAVGAPAPAEKVPLMIYLKRMGIRLDCYFTIEQTPLENDNWITTFEVQDQQNIYSIGKLVDNLSARLKGVHVYRSEENPVIVHIVDARLEKEKDYALAEKTSINYSGSPMGLVDQLHEMHFENLFHKRTLMIGDPLGIGDYTTAVSCSARGKQMRRILTDYIPLSQYDRILWTAESRWSKGKLETDVQFLGTAPRPLLLFLWKYKVDSTEYYLGEPTANGIYPFDAGEVAYANNREGLKTNSSDDLDEKAIVFIRKRMIAQKPLQVRWAMLYLGKRKAESGVPVLLEHLDYRYTTCGVLEESYPAVRALTMIGRPGADAAFKELIEQDESDLRVRLLYAVVRAVNGYHPTRDLVEKALTAAKDDEQSKRLEQALKLLKDEE